MRISPSVSMETEVMIICGDEIPLAVKEGV